MRSTFVVVVSLLLAPVAVLASSGNPPVGISRPSAGLLQKRQHAHFGKRFLSKRAPLKKKRCAAKPKSTGTTNTNTNTTNTDDTGNGQVIKLTDPKCGPSGATAKTTKSTGPNGDIEFLNCGIHESGGWSPPKITIDNVIYKSLDDPEVKKIYQPCTKYFETFEKHAKLNNLPPVFLAAFAMQESTCNPNTMGQGFEVGMFQLSDDKCHKYGIEKCKEVDINTGIAAKYFRDEIDSSDGNLLEALGHYNGWFRGMTEAKAKAAANTVCCRCQNNLDYLHQWLNGWIQGIDAYSAGLGTYFNLRVCT